MINKDLIIQRFSKSLKTYNDEAIIQKNIISKLTEEIKTLNLDNHYNNVLEIGCGTGLLTKKLVDLFSPKHLFLNDICEDVKYYLNKNIFNNLKDVKFVIGDAEKIEFSQQMDIVISTSTIQWFENLEKFLHKCHNIISENGILILTTFGTEHFKEFRNIIGSDNLKYYNINELKQLLKKDFNIRLIKEEKYTLYFDSPYDVLIHCKKTGVNAYKQRMWLKNDIFNFIKSYNYKFNNKFFLTYHPIFIIAKKR